MVVVAVIEGRQEPSSSLMVKGDSDVAAGEKKEEAAVLVKHEHLGCVVNVAVVDKEDKALDSPPPTSICPPVPPVTLGLLSFRSSGLGGETSAEGRRWKKGIDKGIFL